MQRHAMFIVLLTAALLIASPGCGHDSGVAAEPNTPLKMSHSPGEPAEPRGVMKISTAQGSAGSPLEVTYSQAVSRTDAYVLYAYLTRGDDMRSCFGWLVVYVLFSNRSEREPSAQRIEDDSCASQRYWYRPNSAGATSDTDLVRLANVVVSDTGPDALTIPRDLIPSRNLAFGTAIPNGQPYRLCARPKSGATNVCADLLIV